MKLARPLSYVTCEVHKKHGYVSKDEAKRARRSLYPGDHLSAYECTEHPGLFHIGHLNPTLIARGLGERGTDFARKRLNVHPSPVKPSPFMMPKQKVLV